ncbi:MAG TPA: futalosine hydrolase [Ferruginibacter sp.]|jgi:futalosine hydrolase|nr:futalosine hydrolase [Ferruginibacter sp.]
MPHKHEICTMQILLIAATNFEVQPFTSTNNNIDVLITGVGVPATIYNLQKKLQEKRYDVVIQAGIAGTFLNDSELGKTFLVKQDTFGDIGIEEKGNFSTIFKLGFASENDFPFENGWLVNKHLLLSEESVNAITVNKVSDSEIQKQQLIKTYNPVIESMEGAALHYVCLQENLSFLQLRSISNHVGERDKSKWKIKDAISSLNIEIAKTVELLNG